MIGTPEFDAFISGATTAIATTVRRDGSPASSMIGYARDGDRLYFSTTTDRVKGRTLARDPRIVLGVVNENAPNSFVAVEGTVTVHLDNPRELRERMYRYWDALRPQHPDGLGAAMEREQTEAMFTEPGRAIYEVTPTRVSGTII